MQDQFYLEMKNMDVGYNKTALIHDICIGIQKGEIVTLIGPNGAGKSTILKSITRQLKILGGQVVFDQENLHALTYKKMATKVAVVLTDRIKPELMTCYDIVAMGRYPYTNRLGILTEEDQQKIQEALMAVHALELSNCYFDTISDGQKQRILLARAICQEPDMIILDEPTSFLDIKHKMELLSILTQMAKVKNITIIMSLHEIEFAQKISDKIVCVKGDRIFRYGMPEEIFQENTIIELYDIDNGSYNPYFGSVELPKIQGKPEVFVISAAGSGIEVYRKLQKKGIPFAAGILYENDIDYQLAKMLAVEVVTEKPFDIIGEKAYEKAIQLIDQVSYVIDAGVPLGDCNKKMSEVRAYAEKHLKLKL